MQTRKRAKSITFGKPKKEAEATPAEKEEKKVVAPEPEETPKKAPEVIEPVTEKPAEKEPELTEAAKKVLALEEASTEEPKKEEKPKDEEELSETPGIVKGPEAVTPEDEFVTDTTPTNTIEPVSPPAEEEEKTIASDNLSEPTSPITEPEPEKKKEEAAENSDLSPTPPASAFTIAGNDIDASAGDDGKKKNFVLYFIVVALISFVLGLGAMAAVTYFGLVKLPLTGLPTNAQDLVNKVNPMQPTPTTAPTAAPTVAPTEKPVDLKAYTVSVLNGSGIKGKAAEVKGTLTTAGFQVGTTGNADRSDYTTTQIAAKKTVDKAYLDKLTAELKKSFKVEPVSTIPSDSSQTADVIVTLGSEAGN